MLKRVLRHPGTQVAGARVLGGYLSFALRTTRWSLDGAELFMPFGQGRPAVVAFWHETLPLMPAMWRRAQAMRGSATPRMHVLVSRNHDGRLIGDVMRRFGLDLVHGSTAKGGEMKGGVAVVRALAGLLRGGDQIVITPDGPRGPRRVVARGVAQIAALAGVPVVPVAAQTTRRLVLPTWDRMVIPLPFGRGALVCGAPIEVAREDWSRALPAIEAALTRAADRASALCGA